MRIPDKTQIVRRNNFMAKQSTGVKIFDEVCQLDISYLRTFDYMRPYQRRKGIVSWANGNTVHLDVDMRDRILRLELDRRLSIIHLENRPSNLGKGLVWYFRCPETTRLCRKLYLINGRFLSRYACSRAMYRSQAEPKSHRNLRKYITLAGTTKNPKAEWNSLDRKHFRAYYSSKITKRYRDYLERCRKIDALLDSGGLYIL